VRTPRDLVLVGVPIDCVGAPAPDEAPFGTELSPGALRAAGVTEALSGQDAGDLDVRLIGRDRTPRPASSDGRRSSK
jgi:hypothetical protein